MVYQCVVQDIESPRLREADYLSGDLDSFYILDENVGLEIYENPHQIEENLRSPAIKNPTTAKSAHADSEDSTAKTRKEKKLDYIPESEYLDEVVMMPSMEDFYFSPSEEAEVFYLSDFRKLRIPTAAKHDAKELEFAEAA